ncbi:MAG TPA: phosphatidate cytidylyltransferase [Anaerolineae bacterium]|nr:phosphatidate cytidylyltransferase [Anaerolineae bacterium]
MHIEWKPDYTAVALSFAYVLVVIALGEVLRRLGRRAVEFTRKFIHVGVGMWSVGTGLLFDNWYYALIPPAVFVVVNAVLHWTGAVKSLASEDKANLGTLYFPISFAALIYFWWEMPVDLVAAMMPMVWGDAMAAVAGRRYGRYHFTVAGRTRSLEGSLANWLAGWIATLLALLVMPYLAGSPPMSWLAALAYSGLVALVCTLVEAVTPWGMDNLSVPAAATLCLWLLRY